MDCLVLEFQIKIKIVFDFENFKILEPQAQKLCLMWTICVDYENKVNSNQTQNGLFSFCLLYTSRCV